MKAYISLSSAIPNILITFPIIGIILINKIYMNTNINIISFIVLLLTFYLISLLINLSNSYEDIYEDKIYRPKTFKIANIINYKKIRWWIIITHTLTSISILFLFLLTKNYILTFISILLAFFAIVYSVPPYRVKHGYGPLGGIVFSFGLSLVILAGWFYNFQYLNKFIISLWILWIVYHYFLDIELLLRKTYQRLLKEDNIKNLDIKNIIVTDIHAKLSTMLFLEFIFGIISILLIIFLIIYKLIYFGLGLILFFGIVPTILLTILNSLKDPIKNRIDAYKYSILGYMIFYISPLIYSIILLFKNSFG